MTSPTDAAPSPAAPAVPAARARDVRPDAALRARRRRAILCVVGSAAGFGLASAFVKALEGAVPLSQLVLFRNFFAIPPLLLFAWLTAPTGLRPVLRTRHPWLHAQRLGFGLAGMYGAFYGYAHLPLATVTALNFTMPLFLTGLSVLVLKEHVGGARLAALAAGLLGVLVIMRPGMGEETPDLVAVGGVLAGALAWALAMISIRRMGEAGEAGLTIVLWFTIGAAVMAGLAAIPVWVPPTPVQWALLAAIALLSVGAQLLMTAGYRSADASLLAPFEYSAILWTGTLGLAVWGEAPDLFDLLGFAVLIGAGLFIWYRETGPGTR